MVTKSTKYTPEILIPLLKEVLSFNDLARKLGLVPVGSNTTNLKRRCLQYGLDISHMTGQGHNKGKTSNKKKHYSEYLIEYSPMLGRQPIAQIRRAMIESGIPYICKECGLIDIWNGKRLRLHVDHIDGHFWNYKRDNLRFLCPNCHTQTVTWGSQIRV